MKADNTHEASRLVSATYALQDMLAHDRSLYLGLHLADSEPSRSALLPDSVALEVIAAALGIVQARLIRLGVRPEPRLVEGS